jgi:hypothetical protein
MTNKPASLQTFALTDLAQFTKEGEYSTNAGKDFHLFSRAVASRQSARV